MPPYVLAQVTTVVKCRRARGAIAVSMIRVSGLKVYPFLKYAYADVGLYYSAKITSWNERVSIMGCSMTHEIPKKLRHDVGGLVIGAGAAIPVTGYLNVDVGVRFLVSFVPALKYMDTIIPNMGQVTAGLTFKVPLNPSKKG
ncbi:MAG TPA: hypothetical protein PLM53_20535 [Spirochaetota bacterium]|nr:hypothetical protein [Spirochaetota bacterium]HQH99484.1 hypothetical protein [Spirochaetota bacterium]